MEIWIRSQNKSCLGDFIYFDSISKEIVNKGEFRICGVQNGANPRIVLGTYSSEKKSLKVLDMIQEFIKTRVNDDLVFQMPNDDEVKV